MLQICLEFYLLLAEKGKREIIVWTIHKILCRTQQDDNFRIFSVVVGETSYVPSEPFNIINTYLINHKYLPSILSQWHLCMLFMNCDTWEMIYWRLTMSQRIPPPLINIILFSFLQLYSITPKDKKDVRLIIQYLVASLTRKVHQLLPFLSQLVCHCSRYYVVFFVVCVHM